MYIGSFEGRDTQEYVSYDDRKSVDSWEHSDRFMSSLPARSLSAPSH